MVDNRIITPISNPGFSDSNSMANKMSEEKNGQGGEYFMSNVQEEEEGQREEFFQDRSAQLRASLNGLALANEASIRFLSALREKERNKKKKQQKEKEKQEG